MKKNVTATLLALALLCALTTGCGSRNDQGSNGGNTTVTTPSENNGSGGNGGNGGNGGGSSIMDDVEQGLEDAGDALTGNNGSHGANNGNGAQSGVPYDELLDDGRVHDTDGNLNDGENSSSAKSGSR